MPRQDIAVEIFYDGAWHDLVTDDDVLTRDPIVIRRGQGDESPALRPAQVSATLANDDDRYRTSNPESPLYGRAGRGTPARVAVRGVVRGVVEAASWSCDQSRDFRRYPRRGSAWTEFEGGGLSQRVGQWTEPLRSPMFRRIMRLSREPVANPTLRGYWPLEDGDRATQLSNVCPRGLPGNFSGITLQGGDGPPGSERVVQSAAGAVMGGTFRGASTTVGWQLSWSALAPSTPPSTRREMIGWRTSNGYTWSFTVSDAEYGMTVTDVDGTVLEDTVTSYAGTGTDPENGWITFRVLATESGGTVTIEPAWYLAGDGVIWGTTLTFSGTVGALTRWQHVGNASTDGWLFAHLYAVYGDSDSLLGGNTIAAINGYLGETAGARWQRICDEEQVAHDEIGDVGDTQPMGRQVAAPLSDLLQEIASTDDALIYDAIDGLTLVLRTRTSRYTQTPALTIDVTDLPVPPREVTDDQGVHNAVTVAQRDGGQAIAVDGTGPLGTQDPPDGIGERRQTVDVNVAAETVLSDMASWWLRKGTVDLPRYPQVPVNLSVLDAARLTAVESVDVGDVIEITGVREYDLRLRVLGYTERIGTHSRMITFNCAPDRQYDIGTYGVDQTFKRHGSGSTTLKTAVGATTTAVTFRTANALDVWSTSTPYDVVIAGQRCRVTAMGAPSLVSGAYDQAATLVRGVDGITKELPAGEAIQIADGGIWGL